MATSLHSRRSWGRTSVDLLKKSSKMGTEVALSAVKALPRRHLTESCMASSVHIPLFPTFGAGSLVYIVPRETLP